VANIKKQRNGGVEKQRARIAICVMGGTFGGLVALAIAMIATAADGQQGVAAEKVFTMVVPMLGTLMGTVMAYYFSGEAYEKASRSLTDSIGKLTDQKLARIPVKDVMIRRSSMTCVILPKADDGSKVNLKNELIDKLHPPVTRLPVLDDQDVARYIVHQSLIYKFISDKTIEKKKPSDTFDASTQTLKDFLNHPDMQRMVESFAVISTDASLADAKSAMEDMASCQDVFVTETGQPKSPVLGWLTNVEIGKHAKA
jgi:hypothetical protein